MTKKIFLLKEYGANDRDCVKYIEIEKLGKLECGHYFPSINLTGACFSMGIRSEEIEFNSINTVLTEDEFEQLLTYNDKISELGYGIKEGDARYNEGMILYEAITPIIDKLLSDENKKLFDEVVSEEKEFVKNEYDLTNEDVELIFNEYELDYQDRGIVGMVFNDIEEASREEAMQLGYLDTINERYFNYEVLEKDMLESEQYLELPSGKIACVNY